MPRIRVEPAAIECQGPVGETVMDIVTDAGYYWPAGCPKIGECTNCAMEVIAGIGRLSAMGRYERANIVRQRGERALEDPRLRLACQAGVLGDVIVYKPGVERFEAYRLAT